MELKIDKIQEDVTSIKIDIAEIKKDISRNTADLEAHMEQTRLLKAEMNNRVTPIEDHIKMLRGWKVAIVGAAAILMWTVTFLKSLGIF